MLAELNFIPMKESDSGAKLSETKEINNCQLMAREAANAERRCSTPVLTCLRSAGSASAGYWRSLNNSPGLA